jgi:DeoR family transcriptional regulator of aga operon
VIGATVHDEREASANSLMARRATRTVIVADSRKIGRRAFATLSQNTFNTFITGSAISASQLATPRLHLSHTL